MHRLFSLHCFTTPLHVSGPFVAHHQEAESIYLANSTCFTSNSSVGGPGWNGTAVHRVGLLYEYKREAGFIERVVKSESCTKFSSVNLKGKYIWRTHIKMAEE
jgi:hypothetical protein